MRGVDALHFEAGVVGVVLHGERVYAGVQVVGEPGVAQTVQLHLGRELQRGAQLVPSFAEIGEGGVLACRCQLVVHAEQEPVFVVVLLYILQAVYQVFGKCGVSRLVVFGVFARYIYI